MLRYFALPCLAWGALLGAFSRSHASEPVLDKRQQQALLDQVIPAYQRGDTMEVLARLSPMVGRLDDERLKLVDELLRSHQAPVSAKLLAESRRTLVEQGLGGTLPRPKFRELAVAAPHLAGEIKTVLDDVAAHPLLAHELPRRQSLEEYQQLFWQVHVMDNRLINVRRLAEYTGQLVRQVGNVRQHVAKLEPHQREAILADYGALAAHIDALHTDLYERSLEMRVDRLRTSTNVLSDFILSEKNFLAAYSVAVDSRILKEYLTSGAKPTRVSLAEPKLLEEVEWLESLGRERGGDLIAKSEWLYNGLHWWLRGRYGRGADGFGLFKGEFALNSPEDMFRLDMPRDPMEAAKLAKDVDNSYAVDRRHCYTWAWEDRPVPFQKTAIEFH